MVSSRTREILLFNGRSNSNGALDLPQIAAVNGFTLPHAHYGYIPPSLATSDILAPHSLSSQKFTEKAEEERKKGQYRQAKKDFKHAITLDKKNAETYADLALLRLDRAESYKGEIRQALKEVQEKRAKSLIQKAERKGNFTSKGLRRLIEFHARQKDVIKAHAWLEHAEKAGDAATLDADLEYEKAIVRYLELKTRFIDPKKVEATEAKEENDELGQEPLPLPEEEFKEVENHLVTFLALTSNTPSQNGKNLEKLYREERGNANYLLSVIHKKRAERLIDTTCLATRRQELVSKNETWAAFMQNDVPEMYALKRVMASEERKITFLTKKIKEDIVKIQRLDKGDRRDALEQNQLQNRLKREEIKLQYEAHERQFEALIQKGRTLQAEIKTLREEIESSSQKILSQIERAHHYLDASSEYIHSKKHAKKMLKLIHVLDYQEQHVTGNVVPSTLLVKGKLPPIEEVKKMEEAEQKDRRLLITMNGLITSMSSSLGLALVGMGQLLSNTPVGYFVGGLLLAGGLLGTLASLGGLAIVTYFDYREKKHIARLQQKELLKKAIDPKSNQVLFSAPDILVHSLVFHSNTLSKKRALLEHTIHKLYANKANRDIMDVAACLALEDKHNPLYIDVRPEEDVKFKKVKKIWPVSHFLEWSFRRYKRAIPLVLDPDINKMGEDFMATLTSVVLEKVKQNKGKPYAEKEQGKRFIFFTKKDHSRKKVYEALVKQDNERASKALTLKEQHAVEAFQTPMMYRAKVEKKDVIPQTVGLMNSYGGNIEPLKKVAPARIKYLETIQHDCRRFIEREVTYKPLRNPDFDDPMLKPVTQPHKEKDSVTLATLATSIQRRAEFMKYQKFDKLHKGEKCIESLTNLLEERAEYVHVNVERLFQKVQHFRVREREDPALRQEFKEWRAKVRKTLDALCQECAVPYAEGIKTHRWWKPRFEAKERLNLSLTTKIDKHLRELAKLLYAVEERIADIEKKPDVQDRGDTQVTVQNLVRHVKKERSAEHVQNLTQRAEHQNARRLG